MKRLARLAFQSVAIGAVFLTTGSLLAAPAEQADCTYDRFSEQEREIVGDYLFDSMDRDKNAPAGPEAKQIDIIFNANMNACIAQHGWSENEATSAFSYTSTRLLAGTTRSIMQKMGGDGAAADLFFAQNKYRILDEQNAGRSSEEWAKTRLVEMGFATEKSPAFDAVWLYLGLLFQAETEREAFVSGKTPEWTK
jgi:hypothetical protein